MYIHFTLVLISHPRATAGVYFDPNGICDGLLFKDFVLNGFEVSQRDALEHDIAVNMHAAQFK